MTVTSPADTLRCLLDHDLSCFPESTSGTVSTSYACSLPANLRASRSRSMWPMRSACVPHLVVPPPPAATRHRGPERPPRHEGRHRAGGRGRAVRRGSPSTDCVSNTCCSKSGRYSSRLVSSSWCSRASRPGVSTMRNPECARLPTSTSWCGSTTSTVPGVRSRKPGSSAPMRRRRSWTRARAGSRRAACPSISTPVRTPPAARSARVGGSRATRSSSPGTGSVPSSAADGWRTRRVTTRSRFPITGSSRRCSISSRSAGWRPKRSALRGGVPRRGGRQ